MLREPLACLPATRPVGLCVRHWFASLRAAVGFMIHAAEVDSVVLEERRNLTMPGVSATVADEIEALRAVAGGDAINLIRDEPDPAIEAIITTWSKAFDAQRARQLGFRHDASFKEIVEASLEEHPSG